MPAGLRASGAEALHLHAAVGADDVAGLHRHPHVVAVEGLAGEDQVADEAANGGRLVLEPGSFLYPDPRGPEAPVDEAKYVYDTTKFGHAASGHTFGDHFTDAERKAVLEYLKTL